MALALDHILGCYLSSQNADLLVLITLLDFDVHRIKSQHLQKTRHGLLLAF